MQVVTSPPSAMWTKLSRSLNISTGLDIAGRRFDSLQELLHLLSVEVALTPAPRFLRFTSRRISARAGFAERLLNDLKRQCEMLVGRLIGSLPILRDNTLYEVRMFRTRAL